MLSVLTLITGGVYVLYRTPVLGLQQLEVNTATGDLTSDVRASVSSAAGIQPGTPLISIDLNAVRANALAVPQIATAQVSRRWPHTVVILISQRIPMAVTTANGATWLLDTGGVPYLKVAAADVPAGLLNIALATPGPKDPATLAALAVIGAIKAPMKAAVASVTALSAYHIVLLLKDGRSVIWGSPENGPRKMQILPAVLSQPGRTFDISDPDLVTASP